jgi:hypothetical protein
MPVEQSTVQSKNVEMRRGTLILLIIGAVGLAFLLRSIPQHAIDVCTPSGHAPAPIGIPPPLCNGNHVLALAALAGSAVMVGSLVLVALRWRSGDDVNRREGSR